MDSNYLALYHRGRKIDIPSDISDLSKYMFTLCAKFTNYDDAVLFALSKSGVSRPYYMYCVFDGSKYEDRYSLFNYYVYNVISVD